MKDIEKIKISATSTVEEALSVIDSGAVKIALVVNNDNQLLGTLSDGDIRRGLLKRKALSDSIEDIYFKNPIVAGEHDSKDDLLHLCSLNKVNQIPIVNSNNQVVDLHILDDFLLPRKYENTVVLMVGGLGTRLRPLTDNAPKPMLNVGGKPILQIIIEGFAKHGFTNIVMCLGYKSDVIQNFFKNGDKFGVNIDYVLEDKRMGTAGALTLLKQRPNEPFFVMNGDLLTNVNYEQMLDFHEHHKSKATMCVREYDIEVPYGVVSVQGESIRSIEEKPTHTFFVNAGIYLLEPDCIDLIPKYQFYDMPTLFEQLIIAKDKITSFPLKEYWLDIGIISEYEKANVDYNKVFLSV